MTTLENALRYYNPKLKTIQGANSKTFSRVPLDTPLTIPQLFEYHANHSPAHPVFVYADEDDQEHALCFPQVYRAIQKAATISAGHFERMGQHYAKPQHNNDDNPPVIGILATADSISFYTLEVALMYLGLTPFPISTRNSALAVAHLVSKTGVQQMFVSADPAMQRLAKETISLLRKDGRELEILPMPTYNDIYGPGGDNALVPMAKANPNRTCLILHSSGSTAFPKPIKFIDRNFRKWGAMFSYGDVDLCGVRFGMQTNPMFHGMGTVFNWTLFSGVTLAMFKPRTPPVVPTPEVYLDSLIATRSEIAYCVPSFVEAWARDPENKEKYKKLRAIIYAGAPMSKQVGDHMTAEGIAVLPFYGSTELGTLTRLIPDPSKVDKSDWEYFEISPHIDAPLIPQAGQPDIYELVALDSATLTPNVFNCVIDGRPAFSTNDLLQRHPTKKNLFRIFGRADDQLMLSTGEKTNPGPLEAILSQDPHVHACLMFGRGRFQNGVLIQPEEPFDPSDDAKLEDFRNKIWPSIEKMNAYAPSHSRIFKEMIMVTSPNKPLEYTAKGTPRRQVCINAYSEEIDALYKRVEESAQVEMEPPRDWSPESTREYVGNVVRKVMKNDEVQDEDDIFLQGCDSLQATWIRNTLTHTLRVASRANVHKVPSNFVYTHPSIVALSNFISGLVSGQTIDADAEQKESIERMRALLDKYSAGLERRFPENIGDGHSNGHANGHAGQPTAQVTLVTGTTGRLGSHILSQLLARNDVDRVFALNREASGSVEALIARQKAAFEHWGLDPNLLDSGKATMYVVNLAQPYFGLSQGEYDEMRQSVTQIIHNAWRVDFQVSLPSFEPLIAGTRNLLDLALNSSVPGGPHVLFVSSIGTLRNYSDAKPAPESLEFGPGFALGTGYCESKWVTEQLLRRAAAKTGLRTTSVRLGQVSGDQRTGGWNTSEWVAALVRVSQRLGCIPMKDEDLTWVAVDVMASTLQEMVTSGELALHLVSPKPVPWSTVFGPIAERLNLPTVPYAEWLKKLEHSAAVANAGPGVAHHESAHNLVDFFKSEGMGGAGVQLSTDKAVRCSKSLSSVRPIDRGDALRYVQYWAKVGHVAA
ncbi:acetyl-CoA synthetase-like protein [Trametes sanguinea]|nr:acetyl-CoA synthetase-like protein [Trametes sanguinea]